MGGNALKHTETRRYNADEYRRAFHKISVGLTKFCNLCYLVPSYSSKESFGDMDVVVVPNSSNMNDLVENIWREFSPNEVVRNSNIVSFNYKDLQVDLLVQPDAKTAFFAYDYFSYNDLGNFMGRTAHRLGFKFGHTGLMYVLRNPENETEVISEILVTDEFGQALEFMGYDQYFHARGFETKEEIFDYAASSKYFEPAQYLLENRPSEARRRDRTRVMYQEILKYFEKKFNLQPGTPKKEVDREEHLQRAFEQFPKFKARFNESLNKHRLEQRFKANFNGEVFSALLNVEGKQLGERMKKYRKYFERHDLKKWVGDLSPNAFKAVVLSLELEVNSEDLVDGN